MKYRKVLVLIESLSLIFSAMPGAAWAGETADEELVAAELLSDEYEADEFEEIQEILVEGTSEAPDGSGLLIDDAGAQDGGETEADAFEDLTEGSGETEDPGNPDAAEETEETEDQEQTELSEETVTESETEIFLEEEETGTEEITEQETEEEATQLLCEMGDTLFLEYDDRYSFEVEWPDYAIVDIQNLEVTSYQVEGGAKQAEQDEFVLVADETGENPEQDVIAAGTGSAMVTLVEKEDLEDAKAILAGEYDGEEKIVEGISVPVEVEAAPLTVMYLTGQSNVEGICDPAIGYKPEESVLNQRGEVYSTFPAKVESRGTAATGITWTSSCPYGDNADQFVPGALTSEYSVSGTKMEYPVYALTQDGKGKTGPDSAMAWQWNNLTGDKVWVVNASYGGSAVEGWMPGRLYGTRAEKILTQAEKTLDAEVAAGHFVMQHKLMFWMQGEADYKMTAARYEECFNAVYNNFQSKFGIEKWGLITVRSSGTEYPGDRRDIKLNGPRIAQYMLAMKSSNIYIVSNENERWVTDNGVSSYFSSKYQGGTLPYPVRNGKQSLPSTVAQIHNNIHYSQQGHNENGVCAAQGMYNVINNINVTPVSAAWYDADYNPVSTDTIYTVSSDLTLVPVVYPVTAMKNIRVYDPKGCVSYGTAGPMKLRSGRSALQILSGSGKLLSAVKVQAMFDDPMPVIMNTKNGLGITWTGDAAADGYKIYRRPAGASTYKLIAAVTGADTNAYVDRATDTTSGISFSYAVEPYNASMVGARSTTVELMRLGKAAIKSIENTSSGIKVTWTKPEGATEYDVYRKTAGTGWSKIATVSAPSLTYLDTKTASGTLYAYCVQARKGVMKGGLSDAVACTRLKTPTSIAASNLTTGVRVTWKPVAGADKYLIYRKQAGQSYQRLAYVTELSYVDTAVANRNGVFTYAVRAYKGSYRSDFEAFTFVRIPRQATVTAVGGRNRAVLSWSTLSNVTGYQVQYADNASWTGAKVWATSNKAIRSYIITNLPANSTQYIRTRTFIRYKGKNYFSAWSKILKVDIK